MDEWSIETKAIRSGIERTMFNEHSEPIFLTSSYIFKNAQQAADRFCNREPGLIYSRFTNPTVQVFQDRLAALEEGECCLSTASGMSAILSLCLGLLKAGDHIIASQSLFGSTIQLLTQWLPRLGIETTLVPLSDINAWREARTAHTKLLFVETPANPTMELCDIRELAQLAHEFGALLAVDNCFCTPVLQKPLKMGADVVVHSATKYLDGQGRVLGGALVGSRQILMDGGIYNFLRCSGPTLSAFNAWVLLKGLETLSLRMERQSTNAHRIAQWLEQQPLVKRVYYPHLPSHPQYALAVQQQVLGGAIITFEVQGGQEQAWKIIDHTKMISITGNLGDTKTTITHPATTTHGRLRPEERLLAGVSDGLIRLSVGLESVQDIQNDLMTNLQ